MIKLIVALGPNNLLGKDDKMSWHIPEEFKHFKETTMGHDLLFGQRTFLGLPGKLPGRKSIVLGYEETPGADESVTSVEELKKVFDRYRNNPDKHIFIAGGKSIYEQFWKEASEMIISKVSTEEKGNVFLDIDFSNCKKQLIKKHSNFDVYIYYNN